MPVHGKPHHHSPSLSASSNCSQGVQHSEGREALESCRLERSGPSTQHSPPGPHFQRKARTLWHTQSRRQRKGSRRYNGGFSQTDRWRASTDGSNSPSSTSHVETDMLGRRTDDSRGALTLKAIQKPSSTSKPSSSSQSSIPRQEETFTALTFIIATMFRRTSNGDVRQTCGGYGEAQRHLARASTPGFAARWLTAR